MLTLMREMSVICVSVLSNLTSSLTRPLLLPTEMNLDNATTHHLLRTALDADQSQVTKSAKNFVWWDLNPCLAVCKTMHIPLDQRQILTCHRSGTMYRPRDEQFCCKLRDALGFHIAPTTEQPKGRRDWALGLRSWALGSSFAEKKRLAGTLRRNVGSFSPERGGGGVLQGVSGSGCRCIFTPNSSLQACGH